MRITRLLRSESIRVAALTATLFMLATGGFTGVVLWIVSSTQRTALMHANEDDIGLVLSGYREEGLGEAKEVLRQRMGASLDGAAAGSQTYMRLQGSDERHSLGNLPTLPETVGPVDLALDRHSGQLRSDRSGGRIVRISGEGVRLDDSYYLFVGRGTSALEKTREDILHAFLWVMLGSVILAVVGGIWLALRLIKRVDTITQTCEGIIAGRWQERVALGGAGSEWDRLVRTINEMLNRISTLLENLQQVSSDIAHDLRTPLTRMRNRLENARDAPDSLADHPGAIGRAIEDTDQILALFAAILRIAQVESGTRAASFRRVSLAAMAANACELFKPAAEDSHRNLYCTVGPSGQVSGDPELLFQMLSNLIENALRYTPEGSSIRVSVTESAARSIVEVSDNGAGIPEADLAKVTRRFYRVEGSRTSPGHGLGLALVSAIASLHGARLTLKNGLPGLIARVEFDGHEIHAAAQAVTGAS